MSAKIPYSVDIPKTDDRIPLRLLEIKEWLSLHTIQAKLFASADMVSELGLLLAVAF